mmetsp:Transcript_14987/g.38305  ORF Transcript_14987/g.38305 Transcript_14987/m.38305 type:complete len:214 (-) Transcript_14987:61-702(-)
MSRSRIRWKWRHETRETAYLVVNDRLNHRLPSTAANNLHALEGPNRIVTVRKALAILVDPAHDVEGVVREEPFEVQRVAQHLRDRRERHLLRVLVLVLPQLELQHLVQRRCVGLHPRRRDHRLIGQLENAGDAAGRYRVSEAEAGVARDDAKVLPGDGEDGSAVVFVGRKRDLLAAEGYRRSWLGGGDGVSGAVSRNIRAGGREDVRSGVEKV